MKKLIDADKLIHDLPEQIDITKRMLDKVIKVIDNQEPVGFGGVNMRNKERLDGFYDQLKEVHKKSFPDFRFCQLMLDFLGWVMKTKKEDPFFIEEDLCITWLKEYARSNSHFFQGWDLYPEEVKP